MTQIPKRVVIIGPTSRCFDVLWGAELNENTVIPPGLVVKVVVRFKSLEDVTVNDMLTILVHEDGAIIVPLLTTSESPPILERTARSDATKIKI